MADKKFTVRPGARVRLELPARAADTEEPDERRRGSLTPSDDEPARYVFRDSPDFTLHDLGTRLVSAAPYSYRELTLRAAVSYDTSVIPVDPTNFVTPLLTLSEESLAAVDAELLGGDPFGYTSVGGRRTTPNVLALNHDTPGGLGQAVVDFYTAPGGTIYPTYDLDEESAWKWAAREVPADDWSNDVTEYGLAPHAGRYVQRRPQKYTNFFLFDTRCWDWWYRLPAAYKLTAAPDFAAEAVAPALQFPLRVFGVPALYRPYEAVGCRVDVPGGIGLVEPGLVSSHAFANVQEWAVNFTVRVPQIPRPFPPGWEAWAEDHYPPELFTTLKRVATLGPGAPTEATAVTYELLNRRPRALAEVHDEAVALATALAEAPTAAPLVDSVTVPYGMVRISKPAGHLVGAVEVKGKVYYVWRV